MIGIYKITSPTNRVYIGQSVNIKKRLSRYKNNECRTQPKLYNSFVKHGFSKHIIEILCECDISELNEKERYYQDLYSSIGKNGMNCTLTKTDSKSGEHSIETRLKISKANKGYKMTDATKKKLSDINKGNSFFKGKNHTIETRLKISEKCKGKPKSKLHIKTLVDINSKKVLNTKNGCVYNSIRECAKENGITQNSLGRYLNNKRKNKTNFIFYDNK